ncbi:MAG: ABC transporter ATP-binding protein [Spirochaetes bacterium]|nr:ABC transporter ATP-binding protein [Spirochaetota bacterium]
MSDAAIVVDNVAKRYKIYKHPRDRLKEILFFGQRSYHHDFWALKDVSFEIKKGETVGIIGQNGSGKSTLLQIIAGVLQPTSGSVIRNGRISSLLELGTGFNPDFTGRANVLMNGALMGFTQKEMEARMPLIEEFAEIGEFIDQPVKTYSSGMYVRLAFAAAINVDPDILIVDEALAVGDMVFQAKCMTKLHLLKQRGISVVLVSHDLSTIRALSGICLWIDNGACVLYREPAYVTAEYARKYIEKINKNTDAQKNDADKIAMQSIGDFNRLEHFRTGSGEMQFSKISILGKNGQPIGATVDFDQEITIILDLIARRVNTHVSVAYQIRDSKMQPILGYDTFASRNGVYDTNFSEGDHLQVVFTTKTPLIHGRYSINILVSHFDDTKNFSDVVFFDWIENAYIFEVCIKQPTQVFSIVQIPATIEYSISRESAV